MGTALRAFAHPTLASAPCAARFCSMKITQHVRDYAARLGGNEKAGLYPDAAEQGMKEMSKKFIDMGAEVYVDKAQAGKEANNTL